MTDIVQGTEDWFAARLGKVTASRVADVIAKTKTGYSTSRANYAAQLVCERLTGTREEAYTNAAMQWGTDKEPDARALYEFRNEVEVSEVGFVVHPRIDMSGASPDGLVGDLGMVEIKCPLTATHIEALRTGTVPGKYVTQMMWQMACTGRQWCDFVSYDPRLPERHRLFIKRVPFSLERATELESEVISFLAEVDKTIADLEATVQAATNQ